MAPEARGDTDTGIVPGDRIGTEDRPQGREQSLAQSPAGWLAGTDDPRPRVPFAPKLAELSAAQMMQDEVSDDGLTIRVASESAQVCLVPNEPRRLSRSRPTVQARRGNAAGRQFSAKFTTASADLDQTLSGAQRGAQGPDDPAMVAHQPVYHAQIPPAAAGIVAIGRESVQQLRLKDPIHFRKAQRRRVGVGRGA